MTQFFKNLDLMLSFLPSGFIQDLFKALLLAFMCVAVINAVRLLVGMIRGR